MFSGDLKSISLSDIFQNLSQNERTGRLRISGADGFDIFFRKGKLSGVEKTRDGVDEYLWGVLRNRGRVPLDDFNRVLKKQKPPQGPLATAVRLKVVDEDTAADLLRYYVNERVLDAFSLDEGTFEFLEGEEALQDALAEWERFPVIIEPEKLMFEAARRADEWARIKKNIISADEIFTPCLNIRESVREGIDGEDLEVFVNIDGIRTLKEVLEVSRDSKFAVYSAVSRLLTRKMIRPLQVNQTVRLAQSLFEEGNFEKCIEVARKGLSVERNTPALRHVLARALSRCGEEGQAAEELKLLALSYIDDGKAGKAVETYREVVEIVPSDVDSRQRIFDLTLANGPTQEGLAEGKTFVATLRDFGLNARARDTLKKLREVAPDDVDLMHTYAEASLDVGEKAEAVKTYHLLAAKLIDEDELDTAAMVYRKIVDVAPEDERAKRLLGEIEEGVFREREKKRRLVRRLVAAALAFLVVTAWVVYDFVARVSYVDMNRLAAVSMADGDWSGALDRVEDFREGWPFTTSQASARRYAWTLRILASVHKAREVLAAGRAGEARQWYDEAAAKARAHLGPADPLTQLVEKERAEKTAGTVAQGG